MRENLLHKLKCPICHSVEFELYSEYANSLEIIEGYITCNNCNNYFPITSGVVELFHELDIETKRERIERDAKSRDWEVERQRPYINDKPDTPWIWTSFAANVNQGLNYFQLRGKNVLDIGAATCWSTRMICERGAQAVALDISTGMLIDGEAQFESNIFFDRVAAVMENLPFINESFDAVFSSATVHHSSFLNKTFNEISRVLTSDGYLILVNEPVLGLLRKSSNFGKDEINIGMDEHIYTLREYRIAAEGSGLETKILFPDSLANQLSGLIDRPSTLPPWMMKFIWQYIPKSKYLSVMKTWGSLFGFDLVMVGLKN